MVNTQFRIAYMGTQKEVVMTQNNFANALAIALTLTDEDKALLTQTLVAMSGRAIVSAPTVLAQETVSQSAPTRKERNTTPKECTDMDVHVELLGKGHVGFFTEGEDGKRNGVATRYMQCVKASVQKDELKLVWDAEFERKDVYAKDYTDNKGVFHAKGSHKHGAYTLVKVGKDGEPKALAQTAVKAWADKHGIIAISASDAQEADNKRIERNTRKNERDARKGA